MLFSAEGTPGGLPDVLENLLPNLPNFIAHVLATIVIITLLVKLVYKPFKQTVENRRNKINELLDEASNKQALANKDRKDAKILLDNAKAESQVIVNIARTEADEQKMSIIENARTEAMNIQTHAKQSIESEKHEAQEEIRKNIINLAFEAANKILEKEVSSDKNEQLINELLDELD